MKSRIRLLLLAGLVLFVSPSYGQSLDFLGGLTFNSFYHTEQKAGSFQHHYDTGAGFSFGAGTMFDAQKASGKPFVLAFRVAFSKYTTSFQMSDGGRSYQNSTQAKIDHSSLDIGFYPFNIRIKNRLWIHVGGEFNLLLQDKTQATKSSWQQCVCPSGIESQKGPVQITRNNSIRLSSIFSYKIPISATVSFVPHYQLSLGLIDEFVHIQTNTKAIRHTFWIGIRKDL